MTEQEKILRHNYANTFASHDGQKVLEDLSKICHENGQTVCFGESDKSLVRAGERNVILYIRRQLKPLSQEKKDTVEHKQIL